MTEAVSSQTRKQIEFAKREEEILKAAISLFENPHWETVTVEQISKKAEIGKGTVYKHFASKEELYARITILFWRRLLATFDALPAQNELIGDVRQMIRTSFDMFINNPAEARVSFYCKRVDYRERLSDDTKAEFEDLENAFESYIGSMLEPGIKSGLFPDMPIEHLMMGLEATFDGAISTIWNGDISACIPEFDLDSYINLISEYMVAGLLGLAKSRS